MQGYSRRHKLLITALLVFWAIGFTLSLDDALRQTAFSPIDIDAAPSARTFPRLSALRSSMGAHEAGLRVGDRLLSLGGIDLEGAGILEWTAALTRYSGGNRVLALEYDRDGQRAMVELTAGSYARFWPRLVASLAYVLCAAFLLIKLPARPLVRTLVYMNLAAASLLACTFAGSPLETAISGGHEVLGLAIAPPLALRAFMLLPDGRRQPPRWAWYGVWAFSLLAVADFSLFWGFPFSRWMGLVASAALAVVYSGLLAVLLARAYRRSDLVGRRKLRWVLLGTYVAMLPIAIALALATMRPEAISTVTPTGGLLAAIPVSIIIATTRYNFLDIDRLWSSTTSISLLAGLGLLVFFLGLPPVASAAAGRLGLHPTVVQLLFASGIAGLLWLAYQPLRPRIDQLLFAQQHELEQRVAELIQQLSQCDDPEALTQTVGVGVNQLFHPASAVVFIRTGEVFAPGYVSGPARPISFTADSPLIAVLEQEAGILALEGQIGEPDPKLGAFQRAVLETLDVPLAIPVRREGQLVAFLCLDVKESGDVYTATDLSLLGLLADKVSSELLRFRQSEMLRAGQALQDRLREYVPGALAEQIDRGEELSTREEEVTVLFVDLQGYSRMTEPLAPDQIFSMVNRYTTAVSELIRDSGGTIVEFNGDGMMAVFGAPRRLDHKESAAVAAGRSIVERIPGLVGTSERLRVGVGVATGPALVGNVHAVDRLIWTALGNTTNLASRLQSLTRDLGAPMIIDEVTWERSGADPAAFLPVREFPIRGRRTRENVYVFASPATA